MKTNGQKHPLAEVFGYQVSDRSRDAARFRKNRLCPFNNIIPNCTKDKAQSPLGVCSIFHAEDFVITCPIRFRQNWIIADDAAQFFFGHDANWTALTEVRLKDAEGGSAGNIDMVLCAYDDSGRIEDFGALEIQAVYISGNVRRPFEYYMADPETNCHMDWSQQPNCPRPDYLSSSRKRLVSYLTSKGLIIHNKRVKQIVVTQNSFLTTLPAFPTTHDSLSDFAFFCYDLEYRQHDESWQLKLANAVYTQYTDVCDLLISASGA